MKKINHRITTSDKVTLDLTLQEVGSPLWLVVVHGLGEHKGRHDHLFNLLGEDFNIASFDLRGHGKSDGRRADIEDFSLYINDLNSVLEFLKSEYKLSSCILMGHSMGGLIVTRFLQSEPQLTPEATFLSSPALGSGGIAGKVVNLISSRVLKKLASLKKGIYLKGVLDLKKLSHNYLIYQNYIADPLNSLKTNSKLLLQIVHEADQAQKQSYKLRNHTLYGAIGSEDVLVSPAAMTSFFEGIDKKDNLKVIRGGFHELHNETPEYKDRYIAYLKSTLLSFRYNNED